jgi:CHAT domain-containing protein
VGKDNLQFFYLSCCRGGATDTRHNGFYNYTGMLDAISSTGVPNVLGMRWPISAGDAKRFAHSFYTHFFKQNDSVEVALLKARKAALHYEDHTVWCSPVLVKQEF